MSSSDPLVFYYQEISGSPGLNAIVKICSPTYIVSPARDKPSFIKLVGQSFNYMIFLNTIATSNS